MTTNTTLPQLTASQRASADGHMERQAEWRYYRVNGVRYVSLPSSTSGKRYQVRADAKACSCPAYQTWGYATCSHMEAVRRANEQDTDDVPIDLAFASLATAKRGGSAGAAIRKRYEDIFGEED